MLIVVFPPAKCVTAWTPKRIDKHVFRVQIAGSMRKPVAHSIVSSNDAAAANANERKLIRLGCGFGSEVDTPIQLVGRPCKK